MFRLTRKPSSGSHSQYLTKITHLVQCGYMEVEQTFSVCTVCAVHGVCCALCDRITQRRVYTRLTGHIMQP
jgi:anaerobic ribonucleoside-triphosphate reductase